jgi:hypothetical protein
MERVSRIWAWLVRLPEELPGVVLAVIAAIEPFTRPDAYVVIPTVILLAGWFVAASAHRRQIESGLRAEQKAVIRHGIRTRTRELANDLDKLAARIYQELLGETAGTVERDKLRGIFGGDYFGRMHGVVDEYKTVLRYNDDNVREIDALLTTFKKTRYQSPDPFSVNDIMQLTNCLRKLARTVL